MTLKCGVCTKAFEARTKSARYCSATCRQRARRGTPMSSKPAKGEVDLEQATRLELERLGKLDTMLGQQALVVSRRMTNGVETGSAVATLSREHSRLMAVITAGAEDDDPLDELERRRSAKARQAATHSA